MAEYAQPASKRLRPNGTGDDENLEIVDLQRALEKDSI
jgi:hypothetical protein